MTGTPLPVQGAVGVVDNDVQSDEYGTTASKCGLALVALQKRFGFEIDETIKNVSSYFHGDTLGPESPLMGQTIFIKWTHKVGWELGIISPVPDNQLQHARQETYNCIVSFPWSDETAPLVKLAASTYISNHDFSSSYPRLSWTIARKSPLDNTSSATLLNPVHTPVLGRPSYTRKAPTHGPTSKSKSPRT